MFLVWIYHWLTSSLQWRCLVITELKQWVPLLQANNEGLHTMFKILVYIYVCHGIEINASEDGHIWQLIVSRPSCVSTYRTCRCSERIKSLGVQRHFGILKIISSHSLKLPQGSANDLFTSLTSKFTGPKGMNFLKGYPSMNLVLLLVGLGSR